MSEVASDNEISGKETLEETSMDIEAVKDNLEEISKKVENVENQLSEEQENIRKIIESVGEIQTEITATESMLLESPKGNIQTKQNLLIYFLGIAFVIIIFWIVGCSLEWLINKIKLGAEWLINKIKSGQGWLINIIKSGLGWLINKIKSGLEWLINKIKKYEKERKSRNSEEQIGEYTNLSAEDIFYQFRNEYKEKDKKWCIVMVMLILSYFIIPVFYFIFIKYFPNYMYLWSLLMPGPAVSCLAVLSNKKYKKQPNLPVLVLSIWFFILFLFYTDAIKLDSYLVFLISLLFYPAFLLSIIHFEYTNFKDSGLRKAHQILNKIIEENGIAIAQSSFDILVMFSSKIEDELIMDIKYILASLGALVGIPFIKNVINENMNALFGNGMSDDVVSIAVSLIMLLPIFYYLYKDFNWKADLYKKVLKDMQFTYTLKGKLDYDEK